jgi:hypothetical protein
MKYDLHTHTKYSRCSLIEPGMNVKQAIKKGISGIAVTDHNTIKGALKTKTLADSDFEVIVGEEVMTNCGEILAYYVNEEIKPGNYNDVLDRIKAQGAIASLAHPFSRGIKRKMAGIDKELIKRVDAVEVFNARTSTRANNKAKTLAENYRLGMSGGSDAHLTWEVGRGYTIARNDLRKELLQKKTSAFGNNNLLLVGRVMSLPIMMTRKIIR